MAKSIRQRVDEAFAIDDTDNAKKFLEIALSSWKQVTTSLARTNTVIILLAAILKF